LIEAQSLPFPTDHFFCSTDLKLQISVTSFHVSELSECSNSDKPIRRHLASGSRALQIFVGKFNHSFWKIAISNHTVCRNFIGLGNYHFNGQNLSRTEKIYRLEKGCFSVSDFFIKFWKFSMKTAWYGFSTEEFPQKL
jgi:hypothetical protein